MVPADKVTPSEAGKILGVSRQRVDVFISEGRLKVVDRVGPQKMRLLERAEVERFKRERKKKAKSKTG